MPSRAASRPDPGQRLLHSAFQLFDREGIRAVGIDRLIADAGVARASLYQHFGSKDSLVLAYLRRTDHLDRERYQRATRAMAARPLERIRTVFALAESSARRRDYRGCLYLNALTEFPNPASGVAAIVTAHRDWQLRQLSSALSQAGVDDPEPLAQSLQLLYDGGLVGAKSARNTEPIRRAAQLAEQLITPRLAAGQPG
jgi:AcrR family transcriptional regulator